MKRQHLAIVFGCFMGSALGPAVTVFFTLGLLLDPLTREFGWSQAEISLVIPGLTLAVALSSPIAGMLIDKLGARFVVLLSMSTYGASLFLFQFVQSLTAFYLLFILIGVLCSGSNTMSFVTVLAAWFDKNRGIMIGIATSGIGAGTLILSPIVQWVIETGGWRTAYATIGGIILLVGVPVFFFTIKPSPDQVVARAARVNGEAPVTEAEPIPFREVLKFRPVWLIAIGFVCFEGAIYSIGVYLAPIIQSNGDPVAFSVLCVSAFGGATLVGRIVTGVLFDRFFAPLVCAGVFFLSFLGMLALSFGAASWLAFLAAIMIGFSSGTEGDALGYLTSRYVPRTFFARVYSIVFGCCMASLSGFPFLTGLAFDTFGNYRNAIWLMAGLTLISILCLLRLPAFAVLPKKAEAATAAD